VSGDALGAIQPAAEALSASAAEGRSLGVRQVANPCSEEPYVLMHARTDLWEPWAGNRPGRPGHSTLRDIIGGKEVNIQIASFAIII
jgi:hypothetical protein